jgi:decaprenyl-phosphate phosphoribosyltransferase
MMRGIFKTMRPKQWVKNILLGAAPFSAGVLFTTGGRVLLAAGAFSLVASGAYCINDAVDVAKDRTHPRKQHRPVAAGVVPVAAAWIAGVLLIGAGAAVAATLSLPFLGIVAVYSTYTFSYTFVLKKIPTVELVALASGFVLRAVAGAVAVGTAVSAWFFVCVAGGALLMASGKRSAELAVGTGSRPVLASYTSSYLETVRSAAVAVALSSYALWAFDGPLHGSAAAQVSLLPLTTAILRYAQIASSGGGGEPEDVVLHDRILQVCGVFWAVLMAVAVGV